MDLRKLQRTVVDALDDIKAQDIQVFNTTEQTGLFDRLIIATGSSNRQTRALASHVREKVKEAGGHIISVEGEESGEWVLVDLGDAVVHIMQPAIRAYYRLEELWGAKPVALRVGPAAKPATRSGASKTPSAKSAARPAPSKAPAAKAAARSPASKPASAKPATRSAPSKVPAGKATTGVSTPRKARGASATAASRNTRKPASGS